MISIQGNKTNSSNLQNQVKQLTCIYRNESEMIQIVRISQPNNNFLERSVLPNQYIHFSASANALLEIYEGIMSGLVHADTIPCYQLAMTTDIDKAPNRTNAKASINESFKDLHDVLAAVAA